MTMVPVIWLLMSIAKIRGCPAPASGAVFANRYFYYRGCSHRNCQSCMRFASRVYPANETALGIDDMSI